MATLASFAQDFAKRIFELDGPLPVAMFADSKLVTCRFYSASILEVQHLDVLVNFGWVGVS